MKLGILKKIKSNHNNLRRTLLVEGFFLNFPKVKKAFTIFGKDFPMGDEGFPISHSWITSRVTKILELGLNDDNEAYIIFVTENSTYLITLLDEKINKEDYLKNNLKKKDKGMIKSCEECNMPCCKTGPGPYASFSPEVYLENYATVESYNTKCIALSSDHKCNLWGTPDLPMECRNYICQTRQYSKSELEIIADVNDRECPNCGCSWTIGSLQKNIFIDKCEICGYSAIWTKSDVASGNTKFANKNSEENA